MKILRAITRFLAFLAILCLVACIALHLATFTTFAGTRSDVLRGAVGLLHVSAIGIVILAFGMEYLTGSAKQSVRGVRIVAPVVIGFVYVVGQAILTRTVLDRAPEGIPSGSPGAYYLHTHGQKLADLTDEEYQRAVTLQARSHAAILALFAGIGASTALHAYAASRSACRTSEPVGPGTVSLQENAVEGSG